MDRPEFGTDGVRGTFGENLTPEYIYILGRSIARVIGIEVPFLIGRDTRASGPVLSAALSSGIESEGGYIHDLEIMTTPGIAMFARQTGQPACVITASHNPASDNGVKVLGADGIKIDGSIEAQIEQRITILMDEPIEKMKSYQPPTITGEGTSFYLQYLYDHLNGMTLDGLSVVLDCANGAAYGVAPSIFEMSGADITKINIESDGVHINDRCGATHLEPLIEKVLEVRADIGFAFDGDADRLIVIDSEGNIRDGDYIIALFALDMKEKAMLTHDTVVTTAMSNGALARYLHQHGIKTSEVSVGDKYVFEEMLKNNYQLGGEQSGHIIRMDIAPWGDGILNALLVAQLIKKKKRTDNSSSTAEILSLFNPMIQLHDKVKVANKKAIEDNPHIVEMIEGEKTVLGESSRIIIRPSGTEEVVRITVEGLDETTLRDALIRLRKSVQEVCC